MKDFVIEICDRNTRKKDCIVFSEKDLFEVRQEAGNKPISPFIVRKMEQKAGEKGYSIAGLKSEPFGIARDILVARERMFSLTGVSVETGESSREAEPVAAMAPLSLVFYDNHAEALEKLKESIRDSKHIPIVWNQARGFLLDRLSINYPLFDGKKVTELSDPREAIKFIIQWPQARVSYIFEDLHHFIGGEGAVHPAIGEIRSLLKDLHRTLGGREERVYCFVPSSYDAPRELQSFLGGPSKSRQGASGWLDRYGKLLTDETYLSRTKPVVGLEGILERVIQILTQMEVSNPLLVGYPGVGKTAVADGLAGMLMKNLVPFPLQGRMLYALSLNRLVAGTRYRGDFEVRLEGLMEEVRKNKDKIIVFIDEIHTLLDAGAAEGAVGAGEILKASLARGEFPCIGATTFAGAEYLAGDPALSRRFRKIIVKEPAPEEALKIMHGVAPAFEQHHGVKIDDAALRSAVELSVNYLPEEYLPGKAIALLDATAAYCRMKGLDRVGELDIRKELRRLQHL